MAVQITTGEYTQILVASKKDVQEIKTVQQVNMEAQAKTEEVRAFNDGGEPLVISTDMGQTTGNIAILKSSSQVFENTVMGGTVTQFSLKDAIKKRFTLFANYKDKISGVTFGSMEAVGCVLNSDGTSEAVSGTLQSTYNVTATAKVSYPKPVCVEKVTTATTTGVATLAHTPIALVTGGKNDSGVSEDYLYKTADESHPTGYALATNTITGLATTGPTEYIVAYTY